MWKFLCWNGTLVALVNGITNRKKNSTTTWFCTKQFFAGIEQKIAEKSHLASSKRRHWSENFLCCCYMLCGYSNWFHNGTTRLINCEKLWSFSQRNSWRNRPHNIAPQQSVLHKSTLDEMCTLSASFRHSNGARDDEVWSFIDCQWIDLERKSGEIPLLAEHNI